MRANREMIIPPVSLFPFLSVLVCLMGVLMFLAASVSLVAPKSFEQNVEYAVQFVKGQRDRTPLSLECTAAGALNLLTDEMYTDIDEELEAASRDILAYDASESDYAEFLRLAAANMQETYVMFYIRPDGINTYSSLREILLMRNEAAGNSTVEIGERPDRGTLNRELSEEVYDRVELGEGQLSFSGKMTPETRDVLKGAVYLPESKAAIDELYAMSNKPPKVVDYGTELMLPDKPILVPKF